MEECNKVFLLNLEGQYNPHSDVYARNEEIMVDWKWNIVENKYWIQIIISEVEIEYMMVASAAINKLESKCEDNKMSEIQLEFDIKAKDQTEWT